MLESGVGKIWKLKFWELFSYKILEKVEVVGVYPDFDNRNSGLVDTLHLESKEISHINSTVDMYITHEWECSYYNL